MMRTHSRDRIILSDLIVCACGAVGEVIVRGRGFWPFKRLGIQWLRSAEGESLVNETMFRRHDCPRK